MDFESNLKGPIPKFCSNICINRFSYSKDIIGKCPVCGDNLLGSFGRAHKKSCCSRKCAGKYKTLVEVPKGYRRIIFRHKIINNLEIGCEHCKILDIDLLVVHHIDRDRKNNDINNLSLLCANCHKKEHHEDSQEMREYIKKLRDAKDAFAERFQQIRDIQ
jgi:5-methylcytosine-specific restriction endonuclease McrA